MGNRASQRRRERQRERKQEQKAQKRTRRRATRDIKSSYRPELQWNKQQRDQLGLDVQNLLQGSASLHGGAMDYLKNIPKQYQGMSEGLPNSYLNNMQEYMGMWNPGDMAAGESTAGQDLSNALASGHLANFGSNAQRMNAYNQSAQREEVLSNRYRQQNIMQGWEDQNQMLNRERSRIMSGMSGDIRSRIQELNEEQSFNDLLQELIGNQLGGPRDQRDRRGPGPGGNGSNNPSGGADTDTGVGGNQATNWYRKLQEIQSLINAGKRNQLPKWMTWGDTDWQEYKKPRRQYLVRNLDWPPQRGKDPEV